jgi:hypothetical protein
VDYHIEPDPEPPKLIPDVIRQKSAAHEKGPSPAILARAFVKFSSLRRPSLCEARAADCLGGTSRNLLEPFARLDDQLDKSLGLRKPR